MLSKTAKFAAKLAWNLLTKALEAKYLVGFSEITKKIAAQLLSVGDKSVKVLTNDNPNDSDEFKLLLEAQKTETAIIGLEVAEEYVLKHVTDELSKMLVISCLQEVRAALAGGEFSNAAILASLPSTEIN
jgi:hypothetical protein